MNYNNNELNKKINIIRDLLDNSKITTQEASLILGLDRDNMDLLFGRVACAKNILVTGGAGFIGSNFIHYILEKYPNYKIVNYDLLTYAANLENLRDCEHKSNYKFIQGNICDEKSVDKIIRENAIDFVVHFAAESHVDRSIAGSKNFADTNIEGTRVLLEAAKNNGSIRFHHVSTDEVFGHLEPEDPPFNEKTPYAPRSPYSASKASSDHLVRAYFHTYGLPITISNCSNNYGKYQFIEKLIPLFITNLAEGEKVPLYGNGKNIRDWIHVDDHNRGVDMIIHKGEIGETYCLGGGNEMSNIEICRRILKIMNKSEDSIEYVTDRAGHDFRYAIDYSKIKAELGWEPEILFEDGLRATIEWYLNNENWWKDKKNLL